MLQKSRKMVSGLLSLFGGRRGRDRELEEEEAETGEVVASWAAAGEGIVARRSCYHSAAFLDPESPAGHTRLLSAFVHTHTLYTRAHTHKRTHAFVFSGASSRVHSIYSIRVICFYYKR